MPPKGMQRPAVCAVHAIGAHVHVAEAALRAALPAGTWGARLLGDDWCRHVTAAGRLLRLKGAGGESLVVRGRPGVGSCQPAGGGRSDMGFHGPH